MLPIRVRDARRMYQRRKSSEGGRSWVVSVRVLAAVMAAERKWPVERRVVRGVEGGGWVLRKAAGRDWEGRGWKFWG